MDYIKFISYCIQQYLVKYVGRQPLPPRDWAQAPMGCGGCQDCNPLDNFLASPYQRSGTFALAAKRRQDTMRKQLHRYFCFEFETSQSGIPRQLTFKKTTQEYEREWKTRYDQAQQELSALRRLHPDFATLTSQIHNELARSLLGPGANQGTAPFMPHGLQNHGFNPQPRQSLFQGPPPPPTNYHQPVPHTHNHGFNPQALQHQRPILPALQSPTHQTLTSITLQTDSFHYRIPVSETELTGPDDSMLFPIPLQIPCPCITHTHTS